MEKKYCLQLPCQSNPTLTRPFPVISATSYPRTHALTFFYLTFDISNNFGCYFFNERRVLQVALGSFAPPYGILFYKLSKVRDSFKIRMEIMGVVLGVMLVGCEILFGTLENRAFLLFLEVFMTFLRRRLGWEGEEGLQLRLSKKETIWLEWTPALSFTHILKRKFWNRISLEFKKQTIEQQTFVFQELRGYS